MLYRFSLVVAVATTGLVLACADRTPTEPSLTASSEESILAKRKHGATLTSAIDQTVGGTHVVGTLRITRIVQNAEGALLFSGVFSGTANGTDVTQEFTDLPGTLSRGEAAPAAVRTMATSAAGSGDLVPASGPMMSVVCDVLLLDLGPLHLDLLGVVIDLSQVILNVDAVTGAGNLLGNLLCAILSLLDGPAALAAVGNILEQVNQILGAV